MVKKRGTADGRAGRRPPRLRRAVWPAAGVPDFAGAIKSGFAG